MAKANNLRDTFNTLWYSQQDKLFVSGFTYPSYDPVTEFSYETSWFIPLKEIPLAGKRATDYLDFIYNSFNASPSTNIEGWSYLPDVYYTWNDNERGWYYLKHIMDSRSYYPEISFVIISAIATGLMGIVPDAPLHAVATMPVYPPIL